MDIHKVTYSTRQLHVNTAKLHFQLVLNEALVASLEDLGGLRQLTEISVALAPAGEISPAGIDAYGNRRRSGRPLRHSRPCRADGAPWSLELKLAADARVPVIEDVDDLDARLRRRADDVSAGPHAAAGAPSRL